jgi:hypothetical protein
MPRVLAAVASEAQRRILAVLPRCNVRFVHTGEQLVHALEEERCEMIIVGTHFDESTAVALLERVLARAKAIPVVCVRGVPSSRLGPPALDTLRVALGELGVRDFIDLLEHPDDEAGNARVRAILEGVLEREPRLRRA